MKSQTHTIQVDNNSSITFTVKYNAINIFEEPQNNLWTFDREGRLVGMYVNGVNYRRTLSNNFYLKSREEILSNVFRHVSKIEEDIIIPLMDKIYSIVKYYITGLPINFRNHFQSILKMDYAALQEDSSIFSDIYLPISILPPDQYMSLVIQVTEGCNYNKCTFCNFYKDRPFKIKSIDELETHIINIKNYLGEGLKLRKSIFLADANAISTPQNRLIQSLVLIQKHFPLLKNIYSFVDVFTGLKKSINDFKLLKQFGLKRVYLGVESGNKDLMSFLNKNQSNADIIELTNTLKASGINVGIILLVGAGGEYFSNKNLDDSVKLIQDLPLSTGDIIYLSELYETNDNYIESMNTMKYNLPSKMQIREWSNTLRKEIKSTLPKEVQVSVYDINQFFY